MNFDKTHFMHFNNASKCTSVTEIIYEGEQISIANETKFLALYNNNNNDNNNNNNNNNNNLSWKTNIESVKNELSSACYVMTLVKPCVTANTLKMIYYGLIL